MWVTSSPSGLGQASYLSICDKELAAPYRSGESPSSKEGVLQTQKTTDSLPQTDLYVFSRDISMPPFFQTKDIDHDDYIYMEIRLCLTQALLGKISPHFREVGCKVKEGRFEIIFFLDQEPSNADSKLIERVVEGVRTNYPQREIIVTVQSIPEPEPISHRSGFVYRRQRNL